MNAILLLLILYGGALQESASVDPDALEWFRKGQKLIGTPQENSDQQAGYFEAALEIQPNFSSARYNLALVYIRQEKTSLALGQLDQLIQSHPGNLKGLRLRARVQFELGRPGAAREDLERALELDDQDEETWHLAGTLRYQQRDFEGAVLAFQKVLELNPHSVDAHFDLALAQQALGRSQQAIENYGRFLADFPQHFEANYLLGLAHQAMGDADAALSFLLKAESIDPTHQELAEALGSLLFDLGRLEEARRRWLVSDLEKSENLANLGILAVRLGEFMLAEDYLRRALEKDPGRPMLWAQLGDLLSQLKRDAEAGRCYEQALNLDPENIDFRYNLATIYARLDRQGEAAELFRRVIAREPDHGPAHYNLALVLDEEGDLGQAQTHYLGAIEHGVDEPYAHFRLAYLWAAQGEGARSLEHLKIAFKREPVTYVTLVRKELLKVRSVLDSIRYTREFNDLMARYEASPVLQPAPPAAPAPGG